MRFKIVRVGRERSDPFASASEDYAARIRKFLPLEEVVLKPDRDDRIAQRMLKEVPRGGLMVPLDEKGKEYDSHGFSKLVSGWMNRGLGEVVFLIGGADGLPAEIRKASAQKIALSKLTFPHRIARLLVLEQIYRALCIIRNVPYQK